MARAVISRADQNAPQRKGDTSLLRIGVVTPYFPMRDEPQRGHSAYQTLRKMTGMAEVRVFSPVATYPEWLQPRTYKFSRAEENYAPPGVNTGYYPYPVLPVISRPINSIVCRNGFEADLRAFQPDVVLNYWLYPEGHAAVQAAHRLNVPAIVCAIGSDVRRIHDAVTRFFVRRTLSQADYVLTVSHELRQQALQLGAHPDRSSVILNGCDSSIFHPASRAEARFALNIDPEEETVVFVGAIIPSKGLRELLDALPLLLTQHPKLAIHCVGEGSLRNELQNTAAAMGLSNRFRFPGTTDSRGVARWITASDVFCLPSYSEGCPNVLIEAISCGRPVVVTDVGGVSELMTPDRGIMIKDITPAAIASAIHQVLSQQWPPERITAGFTRSWENVAQETFDVCSRVAAAGVIRS